MKIIPIFDGHLYSFKYPGEKFDELERLFDEWNDIELLRHFFEINQQDLKYFNIDIDEAILETRKEANAFRKKLIELSKAFNPQLDAMFASLDDMDTRMMELAKQKSKRRWLRLYALRIEKNTFIITGGAIKLTHKMEARPHTTKELRKMELCRNYLKEQGIFDVDTFNELFI